MHKLGKVRQWLLAIPFLVILGTHASIAHAKDYRLRLGHELPLDSPIHRALDAFAKEVHEASGGKVDIQVYGAATLGPDRAISEQVRLGGIELAALGINTQAPLGEDFTIEEVPYVWDSYDQLQQAFDGELGRIFTDRFVKLGARPISFFPFGFRHITNRVRPITSPDDLKGLKIRTAEVPIRMDMFRQLEAQPVPIAFPELFTALQQGTVDGQENPLFIIKSARFFEVQKHLTLSRHIGTTYFLVMNERFRQSLPEDVRAVIDAAASKISAAVSQELMDSEEETLAFLKANGMQVVEQVDRAQMRAKLQPVYEKYKTRFSPELWSVLEEYSSINK